MIGQGLFNNYTPVGDLMVVSICLVMLVLVVFSNISKTRSFRLFLSMIGMLILAALADVSFYTVATYTTCRTFAHVLRCVYHALLFFIFFEYVVYITEVTGLESRRKWPYIVLAGVIYAAVVVTDVISTVRGGSFFVTDQGVQFRGREIFLIGYMAMTALVIALMIRVRRRLYQRVMWGFYGTMAISFGMLFLQGMRGQTSFTVATFLYPVIAMLYILHSNPYDAQLGANDVRAFQDTVRYYAETGGDFIFLSLYLRTFDEQNISFPDEMRAVVRQFATGYFRGASLFQVGKGHMILLCRKRRNRDYEKRIENMLAAFQPIYEKFRYDYKIVIGDAIDVVSRKNEYVDLVRSVHRRMEECTVHRVTQEDIAAFDRSEYILNELGDIYRKGQLDDPRVLAYCQPVLNVVTGQYDTAEALMRLDLKETGVVYPNDFISLAEEHGYIHILTEIILYKTCEAIRQFTEAGYDIKRISVNVSALELKEEAFCSDIIDIIGRTGIPGDKIAIELTESRNESDFNLMKQKISELQGKGIKFYLDDFGTGYSNVERIVELPFDIIKFDRSLVLASGSAEKSKKIVSNLANMFSNMNYYVLYEGVEKDSDEDMCKHMSATYLQGFKYSKPTPIVELKQYIKKDVG